MPHVWTLEMPMVREGDLERFRLVWKQLLNDPSVAKLEATEEMLQPHIRTITVTFKAKYDRPDNPVLRALDKQFYDSLLRVEIRSWYERILDDD